MDRTVFLIAGYIKWVKYVYPQGNVVAGAQHYSIIG